jgi:probable HAF family extracellular repeat protein
MLRAILSAIAKLLNYRFVITAVSCAIVTGAGSVAYSQDLWVSNPYEFNNQPTPKSIPSLYDARFCALTQVTTGGGGLCLIKKAPAGWMMQTGGPNAQSCQVSCFRWAKEVFRSLGYLPGDAASQAEAISADGQAVVGWSAAANATTTKAMRWTDTGGMVELGFLPGGTSSQALAVNSDGSVVAGWGTSTVHTQGEGFRWTQTGGLTPLGTLSTGFSMSKAVGVNADGSVVVGFSTSDAHPNGEAFRWQSGSMTALGVLPGGDSSRATGVSANGLVVVGYSTSAAHPNGEAFMWTQAAGMVSLQIVAPVSQATGISSDGSIVVGWSGPSTDTTTPGTEAFKWTQTGGLAGLGLITAATYSVANGVSADGFTAFGMSGRVIPGNTIAQATGQLLQAVRLQPLQISDVIAGTGYDLTGWRLTATTGVSSNFMFVGNALDPTGQSQAWIAPLFLFRNPNPP